MPMYECTNRWCNQKGLEVECGDLKRSIECSNCRGVMNEVGATEPEDALQEITEITAEMPEPEEFKEVDIGFDPDELVERVEGLSLDIREVCRIIGANMLENRAIEFQRELCNLIYQEGHLGD